jgi:very-short-patch-repair endonuclease
MTNKIILNNRYQLKSNRKGLRNNCTKAEAVLWQHLKGSQLDGKKFRRQHSFGNYILDFYCAPLKLAVELDGARHYTEEGMEYDKRRTEFLERFGIRVIRFENKLVFEDLEGVLRAIKASCNSAGPPPARPL